MTISTEVSRSQSGTEAFNVSKQNTGQVSNKRCTVNPDVLEWVQLSVKEHIPILPRGVNLTAKNILGNELWDGLDEGDRRRVGCCLSYLVANNKVPLIDAGKNSNNSKIYRLA